MLCLPAQLSHLSYCLSTVAIHSLTGPLTRVIENDIGLVAELKASSSERKASEAAEQESHPGEQRPNLS